MIHFNKNINESSLERRFFLALYIFVFCGGLYAGMYAMSFGSITNVKHDVQAALFNPKLYFKYLVANPDNDFPDVRLDFKFKNYIKLSNTRSRYVHNFRHLTGFNWIDWKIQWMDRTKEYIKAEIKYDNQKYKVKTRFFGENNDHVRHPYKWSFRVKSRDKYIHDFQNGRFNLLQPHTRLFITDVLCNKVFQKHGMLHLEYTPINLKINDFEKDIYFIEDFFSKYLIEKNKHRDSYIFTFKSVKHPSRKKMTSDQISDIDKIRYDLINNPMSILDEEKMNVFLAMLFVAQNKHPFLQKNLNFFYNKVSNRVEPTIREVWFQSALSLNSEEELKLKLHKYIEYLGRFNKDLKNYLNIIINDPIRLKAVYDQVVLVSEDIKEITSTNEWIAFKDIIYSKYPRAIHLCKYIEINTNEVLKVASKNTTNIGSDNAQKIIAENTKLDANIILDHTDLIINPGVSVDLNGFNIIINYGKIVAQSPSNKPIEILNTLAKSSASIIVKNAQDTSRLENVIVKQLSHYNNSYWHLPAALTFYESDVIINNSLFEQNLDGDDFINFFRCDFFKLDNVIFNNVNSDAIDSDFSKGIITNSSFKNIGNDAIDGSGSTIDISNCIFDTVEDKVISAGEKSNFTISDSYIKNSEIAFVSKDDSELTESNNTLENNTLDYCVFNKKEEFLHGTLISDKDISQFNYLIEKRSEVFKNGEKLLNLKMMDSVKESLYGIEYGKKSIRK